MAFDSLVIQIGPYACGETPEDLVISAGEFDDDPIDLTGATVHCSWSINGCPPVSVTATVENAAAGQVRVAWGSTPFAAPGRFTASVWAVIGSKKVTLGKVRCLIYTPDVAIT